MITIQELASSIVPSKTVLFLGAGASVPSGLPCGSDLARHLEERLASGDSISGDLMELCGILERRCGRVALVTAIRDRFKSLKPSGGLLAIPEYDWAAIYTTNFDTLVERAYSRCQKQITPIRSNFDYGKIDSRDSTLLLKLHGCVSQDTSDGHPGRMVLTELDYDAYQDFRECLFARLKIDLLTKDVLFVGYALRDAHVRRDVKQASSIQRTSGAPGRIHCLIYERDTDRAAMLEDQGLRVAFGGIDQLMDAIANHHTAAPSVTSSALTSDSLLPPVLRSCTRPVEELSLLESNVSAMFNGSPASYADICKGFTFERSLEETVFRELVNASSEKVCAAIIGVGGVGKTTLARRIASRASKQGIAVWEHDSHFSFKSKPWLTIEKSLSESNRLGLVVVDNAPQFLTELNKLVDNLAESPVSALRLLLVAERSAWLPRRKSSRIFSRGTTFQVSQLDIGDINRLIALLANTPEVRRLVSPEFASLNSIAQSERLKRRCSADMFVSLKHVFATEGLDTILLREYAELAPELQDVYRSVAALEVSGTHVHRQLVIRLLGIQADTLKGILALLEGIVDEYDIKPADGLYGWRTRHEVVAAVLSRYKFSEQDELWDLLSSVVREINPAVWLERQTISQLCGAEFGIKRLTDAERRLKLYRSLIDKAPGERVPRHRLVNELLVSDRIDEAETEIRLAQDAVGVDSPIHRAKTRVTVRRALRTPGLMTQDRLALLRDARRIAFEGVRRFPDDKYSYYVFEEIGWAYYEVSSGNVEYLDEAITMLRKGFEQILDPELGDRLRALEQHRSPIPVPPRWVQSGLSDASGSA